VTSLTGWPASTWRMSCGDAESIHTMKKVPNSTLYHRRASSQKPTTRRTGRRPRWTKNRFFLVNMNTATKMQLKCFRPRHDGLLELTNESFLVHDASTLTKASAHYLFPHGSWP
jgi:hypothetical protein